MKLKIIFLTSHSEYMQEAFIPEAAMNLHMFSMYQQQEADVIGQCLHTIP